MRFGAWVTRGAGLVHSRLKELSSDRILLRFGVYRDPLAGEWEPLQYALRKPAANNRNQPQAHRKYPLPFTMLRLVEN